MMYHTFTLQLPRDYHDPRKHVSVPVLSFFLSLLPVGGVSGPGIAGSHFLFFCWSNTCYLFIESGVLFILNVSCLYPKGWFDHSWRQDSFVCSQALVGWFGIFSSYNHIPALVFEEELAASNNFSHGLPLASVRVMLSTFCMFLILGNNLGHSLSFCLCFHL